jgi:hypothetical protein
MMYMLRDVDPASPVQFSSSGLIGPIGDFSHKPSWYYVYTLRNQLAGLTFDHELDSGDERVRVYQFADPEKNRKVLAVWCPDDGGSAKGFQLDTGPSATRVTVVSLADGEINGIRKTVDTEAGKIAIDVSPSPVFITITGEP